MQNNCDQAATSQFYQAETFQSSKFENNSKDLDILIFTQASSRKLIFLK